MDIKGPIKVGVVEPSPEGNYELHIDFKDEFKVADLAAQGERFRAYIAELGAALKGDLDARDAQGIMLIQQVCEQLQPHVETGEVALGETLVIEVQRTPGVNLADLLR
ncbi:MAG: transcriptional regulator [Sedimenticolaceae bacterium]